MSGTARPQAHRAGLDRYVVRSGKRQGFVHDYSSTLPHAEPDLARTHSAASRLASNSFLAQRAQAVGLDTCVNIPERQTDNYLSPQTLKLTTTAVVGAVWVDCARDFNVVVRLLEKLE